MQEHTDGSPKVEEEAKRIKEKFGDCADVYAENRSDAAEVAGEDREAEHWDQVAEFLDEDDGE